MPTPEEILAALEIDGIARAPAADAEQANEARRRFFQAEKRLGRPIRRWMDRDVLYGIIEREG